MDIDMNGFEPFNKKKPKDHESITKRGVYKDLTISPYRIEYLGVEFIFSSKCKLEKFVRDADYIEYTLNRIEEKIFKFDERNKKFINHDAILYQSILGLYERMKK